MLFKGYEILIVSPSDREYLVAEITKADNFYAEINQEKGFLEIQIYGENEPIKLSFRDFCEVLHRAKLYLVPNNIKKHSLKNEFYIRKEMSTDNIDIYYQDSKIAVVHLLEDNAELSIIIQNGFISLPFDSCYDALMKAYKMLRQ